MKRELKSTVRAAVLDAMEYWPNSHLGDYSRRQDMRSAFKMLRSYPDIWEGIAALERNVSSHVDM